MSPTRSSYIDAEGPVVQRLAALFRDRPPSVIFDIGSCEGEDAVRYARAFPAATVYAVEPLDQNVGRIHATIAERRMTNIVVVPLAFSDHSGTADLFVSSGRPPGAPPDEDWDYGNKSSSLLAPDQHLVIHPWVTFKRVDHVATTTLAEYCDTAGISDIDFIHLDVQGAEILVLEGAGRRLDRVRAIWLEVEAIPLYEHQPLKADVEAFMAAHGFTKLVDSVGRVSGDQLYVRRGSVTLPGVARAGARAAYRRLRRRIRAMKRAILGAC